MMSTPQVEPGHSAAGQRDMHDGPTLAPRAVPYNPTTPRRDLNAVPLPDDPLRHGVTGYGK